MLSPFTLPPSPEAQEAARKVIDKVHAYMRMRPESELHRCGKMFGVLVCKGELINGDLLDSDGHWQSSVLNGGFLYEPNAAILKAGAYKLVAQRFGLQKLDVNTHLYCSEKLVPEFPGRVWRIIDKKDLKQANVLTRNYPLSPEALKKKLHLLDGGTDYVIGCRVAGKPTVLWAERI